MARDPRLLAPSTKTATLLAEGKAVDSLEPATGKVLGTVKLDTAKDYERAVKAAQAVQHEWAMLPAPKRGEIVRLMGEAFRAHKAELSEIVSREMGKIYPEGLGEVQECIDIADFAVGLSRQFYGLSMHSERTRHRMYEQWHPLGTIGIITAFMLGLGIFSLLSIHLRKIRRQQRDWPFSVVLLVSMVAMVSFGYADYFSRQGPDGTKLDLQANWGLANYGRDLLFDGLLQPPRRGSGGQAARPHAP
ncbi:MAG: aldehyde dehydrogenase family protein [Proteobacteria bacterium]|nr:aldehyde dehydrogenase family protein [Pseudomonadota bacterium]